MNWTDFIFGLFLISLGMISGILLFWSWAVWPIAREDITVRAARRRHPSAHRHPSAQPEDA